MFFGLAGCESRINQSRDQTHRKFSLQSIPRFADPHNPSKVRTTAKGAGENAGSGPPDYATCVVSTLLPADSTHNYRYDSFKITLPDKFKGDDTEKVWKEFRYASRRAPGYATAVRTLGGSVRRARCRIPRSQALTDWLRDKFTDFGPGSWYAAHKRAETAAARGHIGGPEQSAEYHCDVYLVLTLCVEEDGEVIPGSCKSYIIGCESGHYVPEEDHDPGGGPGGDDDDPCTPCVQDPDGPKKPCSSGGGGGPPIGSSSEIGDPPTGCEAPPPEDPCDYENPPAYCNAELDEDFVKSSIDTTNLKCDGSYTGTANERETKKAWCASSLPTDGRLQKTKDALDKISKRGDSCAKIAARGSKLLKQHGLRYYPDGTVKAGAKGGPSFGALLSTRWLTYYNNPGTMIDKGDGSIIKINLQFALVHEIEHVLNREHITLSNGKESKLLTAHAVQCSGLK